ncbi:unnamed protein product, partial [Gulo gulo]
MYKFGLLINQVYIILHPITHGGDFSTVTLPVLMKMLMISCHIFRPIPINIFPMYLCFLYPTSNAISLK